MSAEPVWRQQHHGHPHPDVAKSFDETERRGLRTFLFVEGGKPRGGAGHEFRRFERFSVKGPSGALVATARVGAGGLPAAARDVLKALPSR